MNKALQRSASFACVTLFLVTVVGCASLDVARYAPPAGKPVAKVHIEYATNSSAPVAQVMVITRPLGSSCRPGISDMAMLTALGGVPTTNYTPAMSRDVLVGAEEPITIQIGTGTHSLGVGTIITTSCVFRAKFTPEANAQYEMTFKPEQDHCLLSLNKRLTVDGTTKWVKQSFVDPNPECK